MGMQPLICCASEILLSKILKFVAERTQYSFDVRPTFLATEYLIPSSLLFFTPSLVLFRASKWSFENKPYFLL